MDSDNKKIIEAIGGLSKKFDEQIDDVKVRIQKNADDSLKHHESTRKEVTQLRGHVILLWRKVNGSDPPPPPPSSLVKEDDDEEEEIAGANAVSAFVMPLDELAKAGFEKASALDLEVAALRTETMTGFGKMGNQLKGVLTINKAQSDYAGIGKKGLTFLFSREGVKSTAMLIAAVTGLVAALGTCYSISRSAPVPPQAAVPSTTSSHTSNPLPPVLQ